MPASSLRWWGPVWRGLPVEPTGRHYQAMRSSIWLYLYLIVHADRKTGRLYRLMPTIARDMGIRPRTVRYWLSVLRRHGYVTTIKSGRVVQFRIEKWRPMGEKNSR
ncbi:MAG TPA: hypothetical protein VFD58_31200 [Blastocatellia bacterium]|nr:hypothetical protein [Blastocatellia bacterium]